MSSLRLTSKDPLFIIMNCTSEYSRISQCFDQSFSLMDISDKLFKKYQQQESERHNCATIKAVVLEISQLLSEIQVFDVYESLNYRRLYLKSKDSVEDLDELKQIELICEHLQEIYPELAEFSR